MRSKIFIGSLLLCLFGATGLYLHSASRSNTFDQSVSEPITSPQVSAVTAVKIPTAEISVQQPDKKLPVPAHQLKKVIASTPANSEDDLQAKIAAANQSIEALDKELSKQLPKNPDSPEPSSTTDADDNQDIKHRLENIKNHLQKTQ